ncbi:SCO family protein [Guyparkeria hydrothermalis]|uniref:SCO family protein n=1 Tax=Guyparkeria hydrothermalis TaxID=923 RepID=UPI0020227A2C|nr:SCO family protein [Guyparkeria hydrothermalis]MCL7744499.1 SCO family protein [Guyparkeria hydrothermalis]
MRANRVLLPLMLVMLGLAGCRPDAGDNPLAGYQAPDPLVLRTPEAPMPLPDVPLAGVDGELRSADLFHDRWTLLYVGYSFCPDICPTELGQLSRILPVLRQRLPNIPWQVVFLSVDPERDTPAHLEKYTAFFSEEFIPVTGSRKSIDAITAAVKAGYRIEPHEAGQTTYSVDHDTGFRLIDPDGRMLALLPGPHDPPAIVSALENFMSEVTK